MSVALGPSQPLNAFLWRLAESVDWSWGSTLVCRPHWWDLHLPSLVLGLVVGFLLGPLCEAACAWRLQAYHRWTTSLAPAAPPRQRVRPLFRLHCSGQ